MIKNIENDDYGYRDFYMQLASNLVTADSFHLYLSLGVMQYA